MSIKPSSASPSFFYFIKNLFHLYFNPAKFFSRLGLLESKLALLFITYSLGMMATVELLDVYFLSGIVRDSLNFRLFSNWLCYWKMVLVLGLILGLLYWVIGGWWFNLRIKWSGASKINNFHGRIIYVYSLFIVVLPILLCVLLITALFKNYITIYDLFVTAHNSGSIWMIATGLMFVIPLLWSIFVSYKAVVNCFKVSRGKSIFWFVIVPAIFYCSELIAFYLFWLDYLTYI
jgi:hypothetical protein